VGLATLHWTYQDWQQSVWCPLRFLNEKVTGAQIPLAPPSDPGSNKASRGNRGASGRCHSGSAADEARLRIASRGRMAVITGQSS